MKHEIQSYFERLFKRLNQEGKKYPIISNLKGEQNVTLISEPDESGWCQWQPVEKTEFTSFELLEEKYGFKFHQSIKDYYNQYWFYEIYGKMYIKEQKRYDIIELERVLPGREINDLEAHIGHYYWGRDLKEFCMVPIGLVQNLFVVVNNSTGEVFLDDQLEANIFTHLANNIQELLTKLEP